MPDSLFQVFVKLFNLLRLIHHIPIRDSDFIGKAYQEFPSNPLHLAQVTHFVMING